MKIFSGLWRISEARWLVDVVCDLRPVDSQGHSDWTVGNGESVVCTGRHQEAQRKNGQEKTWNKEIERKEERQELGWLFVWMTGIGDPTRSLIPVSISCSSPGTRKPSMTSRYGRRVGLLIIIVNAAVVDWLDKKAYSQSYPLTLYISLQDIHMLFPYIIQITVYVTNIGNVWHTVSCLSSALRSSGRRPLVQTHMYIYI